MPHLATVLGGPLSSDFVIPKELEPPLTLARIFIVAAQNVKTGSAEHRASYVQIRSDRRLGARLSNLLPHSV